ncbi:hypothetical protein GE21DRAFT_1279744 [Neurospora crassa]|nr:hypothetical protein GE21DRAFT_1279744 [Neurospora crassa]
MADNAKRSPPIKAGGLRSSNLVPRNFHVKKQHRQTGSPEFQNSWTALGVNAAAGIRLTVSSVQCAGRQESW